MTFYNNFGRLLVLRVIINKTKREMKNTISILTLLFVVTSVLSAFTDNPTAPYDYFNKFEGDYTDTDGDGMTDVAELRYNYDPNDPNSRPIDIGYFYEENSHIGMVDRIPTGGPEDVMYFRFNKWPEELENQYKDIIIHLMPIFYRLVGEPANNQILDIHNRGKGRFSSWTVSNGGKTMMASEWYNPKMFIHELLHAWKGKYTFTNKQGSSATSWSHTKDTAGFEEGSADGLTIDIIHEFIDCYPNHQMSKFCTSSIQSLRTGTTSTFDFTRGDQFMSCGNLWYDPSSIHHRYAIAGDTFRILTTHDEQFMQKALDKYYAKIDSDMTYRPSAENLINVFAEVLPEVNGVKTKKFLENLPWFSGKKIPNRLHIVNIENHQGWGGGTPWIYPAFANTYGKTYQYNAKHSNIEKHGLPTWLKYYEDKWGYLYPDHMNQPFEVKINTIFGEHIDTIEARTHKGNYDSNGKPKNLGKVSVKSLARSNWPVGLYKQTITFTEYAKHTEHASTDSYFFGYENLSQDKLNEFVIILGVDCEVAEKVVFRLNDYHHTSDIVNGCAIFRTNKIPRNSKFIAEFDVFDVNGSKQTYKRAVIKTAYTRDMLLQHSFVVVDRDFNGIEDIYEENVNSIKNPNHVKYKDIVKSNHPMLLSLNQNYHNNVTITLESDGILIGSDDVNTIYVFDQNDNQLRGLTNKSSGSTKAYLLNFTRIADGEITKLKVRTVKKVDGKNVNSPFRIFNVQDILDGETNDDTNFEFADENLVHNADDLNISSTFGGVQLTWKTYDNEIPKVVLHNYMAKIADRESSGFVIDYENLELNGTEEISAYFEVLDKTEKKLRYRTKEFSFKLSDFKSLQEIEKDKLVKKYNRLVDENNLPKFGVTVRHNGIQLDFNTSEREFGVVNIKFRGRASNFIDYDKFNLKGDETIRVYVEFFNDTLSNKKSVIITDEFDLDLSIFLSDYLAKRSAMESKFAVYADENGSTKCTIIPQENGGVIFEWNDAEGLVSTFAVFKDGKFLTSRVGGSIFLDYKELNLKGTEIIDVRHVVKTINGERVFNSSSTLIDLNDHKFVPESKWNDEFFSFVDENNNPKFEIVNSKSFSDGGMGFKWKDTENFIGLLFVTHGGRDARHLLYGNHNKEFAEINLYPPIDRKRFEKNSIIEFSIMVYDKLGFGDENFHWESNVIAIDTSLFQNKDSENLDNAIVDDNPIEDESNANNQSDEVSSNSNESSNNDESFSSTPALPPVVVNAWDNCKSIGNNWFHLEWFGHFFKQEGNGWVFHETLGWFYTEFTTDFSSIWLFHETHGWVWTTNEYFPYLFNPKTANWLYVVDGGFFSFNDDKWFLSE